MREVVRTVEDVGNRPISSPFHGLRHPGDTVWKLSSLLSTWHNQSQQAELEESKPQLRARMGGGAGQPFPGFWVGEAPLQARQHSTDCLYSLFSSRVPISHLP